MALEEAIIAWSNERRMSTDADERNRNDARSSRCESSALHFQAPKPQLG
jgi:hypothetical protein